MAFNIVQDKEDEIRVFEEKTQSHTAIVFIDMNDFTFKVRDMDDYEIVEFLDRYINIVMPILNKHGGRIDRLMGDGIIAVFGGPFNRLDNPGQTALNACCEAIDTLYGTEFDVKCSIYEGDMIFLKMSGGDFSEYTVSGKGYIAVYRLLTQALRNSIVFFKDNQIRSRIQPVLQGGDWTYGEKSNVELKGLVNSDLALLQYEPRGDRKPC